MSVLGIGYMSPGVTVIFVDRSKWAIFIYKGNSHSLEDLKEWLTVGEVVVDGDVIIDDRKRLVMVTNVDHLNSLEGIPLDSVVVHDNPKKLVEIECIKSLDVEAYVSDKGEITCRTKLLTKQQFREALYEEGHLFNLTRVKSRTSGKKVATKDVKKTSPKEVKNIKDARVPKKIEVEVKDTKEVKAIAESGRVKITTIKEAKAPAVVKEAKVVDVVDVVNKPLKKEDKEPMVTDDSNTIGLERAEEDIVNNISGIEVKEDTQKFIHTVIDKIQDDKPKKEIKKSISDIPDSLKEILDPITEKISGRVPGFKRATVSYLIGTIDKQSFDREARKPAIGAGVDREALNDIMFFAKNHGGLKIWKAFYKLCQNGGTNPSYKTIEKCAENNGCLPKDLKYVIEEVPPSKSVKFSFIPGQSPP